MPFVSLVCGGALIAVGIIGYAHGVATNRASLTALIPAVIGIFLAIFGLLSRSSESLRKHLMHAAAVVALIGFLATAGRLLSKLGDFSLTPAIISTLITAIICLVFLIFAIRSFASARRERGGS